MSKVLHKVLISSSELVRPLQLKKTTFNSILFVVSIQLSINLEKDAIFVDFEVLKNFLTSLPFVHCSAIV